MALAWLQYSDYCMQIQYKRRGVMGVSNEAVQAVERMLTTLRAERDDYRELAHQWRAMCFELAQENQATTRCRARRDRFRRSPAPSSQR